MKCNTERIARIRYVYKRIIICVYRYKQIKKERKKEIDREGGGASRLCET